MKISTMKKILEKVILDEGLSSNAGGKLVVKDDLKVDINQLKKTSDEKRLNADYKSALSAT